MVRIVLNPALPQAPNCPLGKDEGLARAVRMGFTPSASYHRYKSDRPIVFFVRTRGVPELYGWGSLHPQPSAG